MKKICWSIGIKLNVTKFISSKARFDMKYLSLPNESVRKLPYYLAMEEFVARTSRDELFFMWQVEPTVIFGRNQLVENEVNLDYCRANGIQMYRRKSGGGCVYADMSNIMFSYIVSSDDVTTTFCNYTNKVAEMLCSLGLDAMVTGRNDIFIGDKKVSGNAFYHVPGRSIVHGTMLYDTDLTHMALAISPSREKLTSKGVESARNRITTLNQHLDMPIEDFKSYARKYMCDDKEMCLCDDDVLAIERIAAPYYTKEWIYGKNPRCSKSINSRIESVGEFRVELEIKSNKILNINMSGDFFLLSDIDEKLFSRIIGCEYTPEAVERALRDIDLGSIIHGLTIKQFISLIFH